MHVIVEHMFIMTNNNHHFMHAGSRISCDNGQSWVVECKLPKGLVFRKGNVTSFETRRREITWSEWKHRQNYNLRYGIKT